MKLGPIEKFDPNNPEHLDSNKYLIVDYESTGRRPSKIEVGVDFKTDAERRDFTINAMGIDSKGNIIDHFDGTKDIQNQILKTVGDPKQRFSEDYLRMLRLARFASRLGFAIEPKTAQATKELAHNIQNIPAERIMKEVLKMAEQTGDRFAQSILLLDELGMLKYIFPEIVKMKEFKHSVATHPEGAYVRKILS
jgi:tRNA nucleotidyltransferase (CCA-adding enzyme)